MAFLDLEGLKYLGQRLGSVFVRKDALANNLTTTGEGLALDARQGKTLMDAINGKTSTVKGSATLTTSGWSSGGDGYVQTVSVSGVTASSTVIVVAAPDSYKSYGDNLVYCTTQGSDTLSFTATTKPSASLTVNVLILT